MAYVKIIFQNSPSTATPMNAQNLNHMDDQIALNDQRLTELEGAHVSSFNGRTGAVTPADGDYDIGQIAPLTGAQVGQVPVVTNIGTEEDPELVFRMGAGGGAGGHEIIDSEGNTMPQESAMQFPDSHVSDDSTNGRTVVENVKEVTLAELSQATERGMYLATDEESVPIGEIGVDYEEVEADGTKTLGTLLNELYAEIDLSKITEHAVLFRGDDAYYMQLSRITSDNHLLFGSVLGQSSALLEYEAEMFTSGSRIQYAKVQSSGNTITPITNNQPANHTKLRFYYGTSSTVINLKTSANYCQYDENNTIKDVLTTVDTLFDGTLTQGNSATLSKSIVNYRQIVIEFAIDNDVSNSGCVQISIVSPRLNVTYAGGATLFLDNDTTYSALTTIKFTDNTHIKYAMGYVKTWGNKMTVKRVIGVH